MSRLLYADSSFYIALALPKDRWHEAARGILARIGDREVHCNLLLLAEVASVIGSRLGGKASHAAIHAILDDTECTFPATEDIEGAARIQRDLDGVLSLADALCLQQMRSRAIDSIISFDADFDGKGVMRVAEADQLSG